MKGGRRPLRARLRGLGQGLRPGAQVHSPARPPTGVRPPAVGRWSPEKPRAGRVLPPVRRGGGMFWSNCGAESAGARRRGAVGTRGSPRQSPRAGPRWGPTRSGAPWRGGAGRKRAAGRPQEGRWSPARRAASGPVELRPLARGRRGGQEALALTSRGPAGDGGSGHSTPHRPPPAPADSGVGRHCARGGASQLRGSGSRREPGCCRGARGGALVGGLTAGESPRRQRCGGAGFRGPGGGRVGLRGCPVLGEERWTGVRAFLARGMTP